MAVTDITTATGAPNKRWVRIIGNKRQVDRARLLVERLIHSGDVNTPTPYEKGNEAWGEDDEDGPATATGAGTGTGETVEATFPAENLKRFLHVRGTDKVRMGRAKYTSGCGGLRMEGRRDSG